jgi:twitching motility protein PilT
MLSIDELIQSAAERGASDVHFACGVPPKFRIDGQLQDGSEEPMSASDCEQYAKILAGERYQEIMGIGELDLSDEISGHRIRINLFRQQGAVSGALRILSDKIPNLDALGLPAVVHKFPDWQKGIILVTGETGSGKSTTMAAILDRINHTRRDHIITLEDPIEYVYHPDKCLINQREIGSDTRSYAEGLRAILREDPDIILIGEMRDSETIETAMTAAETGHLVLATLHTNSAVDSVDRIVGTFPADKQPQVRLQLSTTLKAVLSQQLLVRKGGHGRAAACECMVVTPAIRNMIREGNTPQMQSALLTSRSVGSITMDNCLLDMVRNNVIDTETAVKAAADPEYVKKNTGMGGTMRTMSSGKLTRF